MTVTSQRLKSGKIKIFVDGEYSFSVPEIIWYSSGISEGNDIDEEALLSLKQEGASSFAYESALNILSLRAHSKKELFMKLSAKYGREAAEKAVERCENAGLTDDEKFAECFARELYERKNYSPVRIKAELSMRGIDRYICENAINSLDIDKNQAIINILNKMHLNYPLSENDRNRAVRRLISMGYSIGEIRKHIDINEE